MSKNLEKLNEEIRQAETQLAQEKHKVQRLENRIKHLEKGERKKRTHRLCNLGGTIESVAPEVKELTRTEIEKPRAKYKAEHEAELKQFYTARRKLTEEFPGGKVDMKKLSAEYDRLEQEHSTTYGEFKTVRDDLHRLWKVKSCVDTAARFNERTEEQKLQNRPQTRQKKEELSR